MVETIHAGMWVRSEGRTEGVKGGESEEWRGRMEGVKYRGREGVKLHRSREVAVVLKQGWSRIYPDPDPEHIAAAECNSHASFAALPAPNGPQRNTCVAHLWGVTILGSE
jgi:hypothetical protein